MATKYRTPLDKWRSQKGHGASRPSDAAVAVKPPAPYSVRDKETESYLDFLRRVWEKSGYPFTPANPGDLLEGTCPIHGRVVKVFNEALVSVCLECYPERTPPDGAKFYYRKDCKR